MNEAKKIKSRIMTSDTLNLLNGHFFLQHCHCRMKIETYYLGIMEALLDSSVKRHNIRLFFDRIGFYLGQ